MLGLREFEILYYFLACKTRTLYLDLQQRFVSKFITLDMKLHNRGPSSYSDEPCTVRHIRNFLRAIWFHLLHPTIVRTIEAAINHRKYQVLKANPLIPKAFDEDTGDASFSPKYSVGINVDHKTISSMFSHLDDVSAMPVPALLCKVAEHAVGNAYSPPEQHMASQSGNDGLHKTWHQTWIPIQDDDEQYIQEEIEKAERGTSGHLVTGIGQADTRQPAKDTGKGLGIQPEGFLIARHEAMPRAIYEKNLDDGSQTPVTALRIRKWIANAPQSEHHASPMTTPESKRVQWADVSTPSTHARESLRTSTLPSNLSGHRMPFHGDAEFQYGPPPLPPKSPSQLARAREIKAQAEVDQLRRENSRLQEVMQQNQTLQRENSKLHDKLSQTSPGRIMRRLSQLSPRARSKSPRKSPRKSHVELML